MQIPPDIDNRNSSTVTMLTESSGSNTQSPHATSLPVSLYASEM